MHIIATSMKIKTLFLSQVELVLYMPPMASRYNHIDPIFHQFYDSKIIIIKDNAVLLISKQNIKFKFKFMINTNDLLIHLNI